MDRHRAIEWDGDGAEGRTLSANVEDVPVMEIVT